MSSVEPRARLLLLLSLLVASPLGSVLGWWLLMGSAGWLPMSNFGVLLQAHGQIQVYGFVSTFTMGVALMMICSPAQITARPLYLAYLCPMLMLAGIGMSVTPVIRELHLPSWFGTFTQMLSIASFGLVLGLSRQKSLKLCPRKEAFTKGQLSLITSGTVWLFLAPMLALKDPTKALETALWGFPGLYIVAVGLRTHPSILGLPPAQAVFLPLLGGLWSLSLTLRWLRDDGLWSFFMAASVALFLANLRPFRTSTRPPAGGAWLRPFVRTAYFWLLIAVILTVASEGPLPHLAGAARHALGSGFVLTMLMGMALRMVPAYEVRRSLWTPGPWALYFLLSIATSMRVSGQAFSNVALTTFGGSLQVLSIWIFSALLVGTCLWGKELGAVKV